MKTFSELLGKSRTPLASLFSADSAGWNDLVMLNDYPESTRMIHHCRQITGPAYKDLREMLFQFPQSLDDFGFVDNFRELFGKKYSDYVAQWIRGDEKVIAQQLDIKKRFQSLCPSKSTNCLYMMIGRIDNIDRVMYVGQARTGLLKRFFDSPGLRPCVNNYIGDCRSYESKKKPNYTWRAKSAELRRRGVYKILWTELPTEILSDVESSLIRLKREHIGKVCKIAGMRDPVNHQE